MARLALPRALRPLLAPLALQLCCWQFCCLGQARAAVGCFCRYAQDAFANLSNVTALDLVPWEPAPAEADPVWTCNAGLRQYKCLRKAFHGRHSVARGRGGDRRAPDSFCGPGRAADACEARDPGGFSVTQGSLGAVQDLELRVVCPPAANCSGASAFLSAVNCDEGPFPNASSTEDRWIVREPSTVIPSPDVIGAFRNPFAYSLDVDGDTLAAAIPWSSTVRLFHPLDSLSAWNTTPVAAYAFPDEPLFTHPVRLFNSRHVAMSSEALITQFEFNDAWLLSFTSAEQIAWKAKGQKAVLFPRGDAWGTEPAVELQGLQDKAGFGITADTDGEYAIIGTLHFAREATLSGTACIFERTAGTWDTAPVAVIHGGSFTGFGQLVAIDAGSISEDGSIVGLATALVGAPDAGTVHVFERTPGGWPTDAASGVLLTRAGASAFPSEYQYPLSLALSGAYAIVACVERAFLYVRRADGQWTDPPVELSGYTGAGAHFADSVAIADLGGGRAVAVAGARGENRALLFEREATTGAWTWSDLSAGGDAGQNPDAFGRSVGAGLYGVAVTCDMKKVFMYSRQLVGSVDRTAAALFTGDGPEYSVGPLDARHLQVGIQYTVCISLNETGEADQEFKDFRDVGASVTLSWSPRHRSAEEL